MTKASARPNILSVGESPPEFRDVYRAECPFVWRAVRRFGANGAAEDLVHDVFTAAFRQWDKLDAKRPVRPWLYGIAYRVMLDHHRKHATHREHPTAEVPDGPATGPGPLEALERREGLSIARQIIEQLEFERRAVLVMHELEDVPMVEIAEAFGIPLNTAYSRLRLARRDFEAAASKFAQEGFP